MLLGLVTAILAWIPYPARSSAACTGGAQLAATDFPSNPEITYGTVGLFIVVRLLDDFVFMPLTIGKSLNMRLAPV